MGKSKELYKYMRIFKPYYDEKNNNLKSNATPEAKEAFKKFQAIMEKYDPLEDIVLPPDLPEDEAK